MEDYGSSTVNPFGSVPNSGSGSSDHDGNPNQRLCSVLLNRFNYLHWSRAVTLALGSKKKLGYIYETVDVPEVGTEGFDSWLSTDQLVRAWLINSMEPSMAIIFSYSSSAGSMWKEIEDFCGNQNNVARVFQLKKDIAKFEQEGKPFIDYLGRLTSMWNELDLYRPHTTDGVILRKRADEDKVFQLLANLSPDYEDLRSHILMNSVLPSFSSVCATVRREETRREAMNVEIRTNHAESSAYVSSYKQSDDRGYKGKKGKCTHCNGNHFRDKCWILFPELKVKFLEEKAKREAKGSAKAYSVSSSSNSVAGPSAALVASSPSSVSVDFTTNPCSLINDFAVFLQQKKKLNEHDHNALLSNFSEFLAEADHVKDSDISGILTAFKTALIINSESDFWVIDSGATDHMTNKIENLHDFEKLSSHVSVANGKGAEVLGKGKINLFSKNIESDALYIPSFPFQLLSVGRIVRTLHCLAIFSPYNVIFQDISTKMKIGEGVFLNGLYYVSKPFLAFQASSSSSFDHLLWHHRLAHPSEKVLSILFPSFSQQVHNCEVCHFSKFTRLPFNSSASRACNPFEIIHSDIWGPVLKSFDGFRYFVTFVDDFTRITWLYLLKFKSEVFDVFKNFHDLVHTQFSSKIKILRSDNGSEYMSHKMSQFLNGNGIIHQTSCVGTPQQNGIAERKNRDLLEKTRAMMFYANVPKRFWSQAVLTATYIINRLPSRILNSKSPLEVLKHRKIDLSHLRVFGSVCYVHVQAKHRDKLDPRAIKCIFLGYSSTQKGYCCYDPVSKKKFVSRDVRFNETVPYFSEQLDTSTQGEFYTDLFPVPNVGTDVAMELSPSLIRNDRVPEPSISFDAGTEAHDAIDEFLGHDVAENQPEAAADTSIVPTLPRRNPCRTRNPPVRHKDYVSYTSRYPVAHYMDIGKFSSAYAAYLSAIDSHIDPQTFQEASQVEAWRQAMNTELKALDDNHTWSLV